MNSNDKKNDIEKTDSSFRSIQQGTTTRAEFVSLIENRDANVDGNTVKEILREEARKISCAIFKNEVYTRGLIEVTNYCRNNCFYCGIRAGNKEVSRYRLTAEEIIECCKTGYDEGFRTFVLQGGEDPLFTDNMVTEIVQRIKSTFSDCAVTLSLGEREKDVYSAWKKAGADRYLLRHESADEEHYRKLHPAALSLAHRKQCLRNLKALGYQTGAGMMVGSPYQSTENLADDLLYMRELRPEMIGIGPFIHALGTPFQECKDGSVELTLFLISVLRIMFPRALIPATTALGTLAADGRERGILCGANVVMPNLSPLANRKKYALYSGKIGTGEDAAECRALLARRVEAIGYTLSTSRGDYPLDMRFQEGNEVLLL